VADGEADGFEEAGEAGIKKWMMREYWRLQQSQSLISMVFWVATLTLLIWPYVRWRIDPNQSILGLPNTYWGISSIAFLVVVFVLFTGRVYDQFLALWKEHQRVAIERNPFATYLLTPRDAIILGHLSAIMRAQYPDDKKIQDQCDWIEKWIATTPDLEVFQRMVTELDSKFGESMPELTFFPDGAVEASRKAAERRHPTHTDK
tara:strand:- start:960 stop:1571 length:612 start_codon:yes stop_codon:yes gene_type:complete